MCVDVKFFQSSHRKKTWSEISSLLQLNHTSSQRKKRWVVFKDQSEIWKNEPGSVYFFLWLHACMCAKLLQSYPTLCNPMDCSLPGSSVYGILQARILEWVAKPSSRRSSQSRDPTQVSCLRHQQAGSLPLVPPGKLFKCMISGYNPIIRWSYFNILLS